jgi:magnesium-protoporphyrin O-methyltransferase
VSDCCGREGYDEVFDERFARRVAKRCGKRGLDRTRRHLVDFVTDHGVEGRTVLEIGGGIGELHLELLRRGARRATNLEISTNYEEEAARLADEAGLRGRVTRRFLDIATAAPHEVEPADIVVLHRVVCCYPDYQRLLTAAADHARQLLVFSHPPRSLIAMASVGVDNTIRRFQHNDFRAFVHPPRAMVSVVESQGMTARYRYRGLAWTVVGFERMESAAAAA